MKALVTLIPVVQLVAAYYANNINYRSPSENHPSLGISIHKVVKRQNPCSSFEPSQLNFTHGVASGDPTSNSVILWTRLAPFLDNVDSNLTVSGYVPLYYHGPTQDELAVSTAPICLDYKVSSDANFADIVASGKAYTSSDIDYTVKIDVDGLSPFTEYYYQFFICNSQVGSPVGRTKTIPRAQDTTSQIRLAVYSCSNYPFGFFNAFGNPVRKDSVDYVIHLGDYIYEYANGQYGWGQSIGRVPLPNRELYTLYDYRKRHATYKTDLDLLASHQHFAWIPVWDDHEVADNTYRDGSSRLNNTEASFVMDGGVSVDQRKANAVRAYFEWMPIRHVDMDDNLRIWRSFQFGDLFDLIILDTRQYDRSITDLYWNTHYVHQISDDAGRSMMGSQQENWFYHRLIESNKRGATWRVIGSQTVFSRLNESLAYGNVDPMDYDAWDGYQSNRNRTLNVLYSNKIGNNIMLSGDSHASWATDLVWLDHETYDSVTGQGSIGVEFGGSAVSSPSPAGANISVKAANEDSQWLIGANQELQWSELYYRGYFELSISHAMVNASYFGMPTVVSRNPYEIPLANFSVMNGNNRLQRPFGTAASGALKGGKINQANISE